MCLPGKACLPGVGENPEGHWGKGGLAAGNSPQTSIHFLFSLQQVCWSLAYLQRRLSLSLEFLVTHINTSALAVL